MMQRPAHAKLEDARDWPETETSSVLIATLSLDVGGAERQIIAYASELSRRGWPVAIFCFNREGALAPVARSSGVRVIPPPVAAEGRTTSSLGRAITSFKASRRLQALLRAEKPKIIHFYLTEPYIFGAPVAVREGVQVKLMSRREMNPERGRILIARRFETLLHPKMDAVLGNSRHVISGLRQEGAPQDRIGLIYNGVDLAQFEASPAKSVVRNELGIPADALVVIKVANLIDYKGHADLVAAIATLDPEMRRRLVVLLVGRDDGEEARLRQQAAQLGVGDTLRFLGLRNDVPRLLAAADIGVYASHMEGFANAVLEAMAAGLPVVATRVGGTTDAIVDGETGFIVAAKAPGELTRAISRLAVDAGLRHAVGAAARRRIEAEFAMTRCVDRIEALYRGLLAGRKPSEIPGVGPDQR